MGFTEAHGNPGVEIEIEAVKTTIPPVVRTVR